MTTLQQPKFVQISNDKYYLFALDEEGAVWKYQGGYSEANKHLNGWYPVEPTRHAATS